MKRDMKKVFSFILVLMLVITLMPTPSVSAYAPGVVIEDTGADEVTTLPESLSDGAIWTDKSVVDNEDGTFGITLKAMGQDYKLETPQPRENLDVVLVLDVSRSMDEELPNDETTTKLESMQDAASAAVDELLSVPGNRVALMSFSNTASTVESFTTDSDELIDEIYDLEADSYTNIQDAFRRAQGLINGRGNQDNKPIIILMSDGAPTRWVNYLITHQNNISNGNWEQDADTPNEAVWWTIQQGMNTHTNGSLVDIDIYTIGFGVGSSLKATATLMPTESNTATFRPNTYSGESYVETSVQKAQYYQQRTKYNYQNWTSIPWPTSWIKADPNQVNTTSTNPDIIRYQAPVSLGTSQGSSTAFSGLTSVPPNTSWSSYSATGTVFDIGSEFSWGNNTQRRIGYFNEARTRTVYVGTPVPVPFNHTYWHEGSSIVSADAQAIIDAFVQIVNNLITFKPTSYTGEGEGKVYSPIIITDVLGEGFAIDGDLPEELELTDDTITWTISAEDFTTMPFGSTSIDPSKVHSVSFTVKLSDEAISGRYETNATASAIFDVLTQNPYYEETTTKTVPLPNIGWVELDGYEPLSVEKAEDITGLADGSPLFADESFSFEILISDGEESDPYQGEYNLYDKNSDDTYTLVESELNPSVDGVFELKPGQKAVFTQLEHDTDFMIKEVQDGDFSGNGFNDPSWSIGVDPENTDAEGYISGTFALGAETGTYAYLCTNEILTTDISFEKYDSQLVETPVSGAAFALTEIETGAEAGTGESDADGVVTFEDIPVGNYAITETDAPTGYELQTTTYQAIVAMVEGELYVTFLDADGIELDGNLYITNDPILRDLTVTKVVKGANAPEMLNPENPEPPVYEFVLTIGSGDYLTDGAITSDGAVYFEKDQQQYNTRVMDFYDTTSYRFGLLADGSITVKVRDGVEYSLYEVPVDEAVTTYQLVGVDGDVSDDNVVEAIMDESSDEITVQNHYGNDGLTVQKLVEGELAPEGVPFLFNADFWTEGDQDVMEQTIMEDEQAALDAATASLAAIDLIQEQRDAVDETQEAAAALEEANQAVADASIDLDNAQDAYDTASASAVGIQEEITELEAALAALDSEDPEYATAAALIQEDIDEQQSQLDDLDVDVLEAELAETQDAYDDAVEAAAQAQTDFDNAQAALDALALDPATVQAYLDAKAAVEEAQANYDDQDAVKLTEILQNIWDRVVNFFKNLVIGETYESGVTDIAYSSEDGVTLSNDEETSQGAFSLKDGEEIVFNFDDYFADPENEGKTIYFEIVEAGDQDADSVTISTVGLDGEDAAGKTITGTITAETGNPIIIYTNDFGDPEPEYELTVIHKSSGGTVFSTSTTTLEAGSDVDESPISVSGYKYSSVSGEDIDITTDSHGNVTGTMPEQDAIIVFIYTKKGGGGGDDDDDPEDPEDPEDPPVIIPDDETPAGPIILEDEAVPAAPLPKTGGLDAMILYGLGALLAGGGLVFRRKENKNK